MELIIKTNKKQELIDITNSIESNIRIKDGLVNIYLPHTTAAIIINENHDPNILTDIQNCLSKLIPEGKWLHDKIDNNGAAHIKSTILGHSQIIPIKNSKLQLGQWQNIFLCEFDGPRTRKIILKQIESTK